MHPEFVCQLVSFAPDFRIGAPNGRWMRYVRFDQRHALVGFRHELVEKIVLCDGRRANRGQNTQGCNISDCGKRFHGASYFPASRILTSRAKCSASWTFPARSAVSRDEEKLAASFLRSSRLSARLSSANRR